MSQRTSRVTLTIIPEHYQQECHDREFRLKTPAAHAATWSRTIRLFTASEAGSQTMRAAGGAKERERSRTGS